MFSKFEGCSETHKVALTFARLKGEGKDAFGDIWVQILTEMAALVMHWLGERVDCVHHTVAWVRTNEFAEVLQWVVCSRDSKTSDIMNKVIITEDTSGDYMMMDNTCMHTRIKVMTMVDMVERMGHMEIQLHLVLLGFGLVVSLIIHLK
uniref:Uncharacterized protein n=1 Tax=Daucus carota subsp. sativus TaxID=79200 RepID=A0A162A121_DAUCS